MPSEQRLVADAMFHQASENLQKEYNARVLEAIKNTRLLGDYWPMTLLRRLQGQEGQMGSCWVAKDAAELEKAILEANWWPHPHMNVMPGCTCFKATLPLIGIEGVVDLRSVPPDKEVILFDPKNTGEATVQIKGYGGRQVTHSCIILGMEEGKEVAFTVHPGDPAPHIGLPVDLVREKYGDKLTAAQAIELGVTFALL